MLSGNNFGSTYILFKFFREKIISFYRLRIPSKGAKWLILQTLS